MITLKAILSMTYDEYSKYLQTKYGLAPMSYFTDDTYTTKNLKQISRAKHGLGIHHFDEDRYDNLMDPFFIKKNKAPFYYQTPTRLVYADMIEHLLLHIKIMEDFKPKASWVDYVNYELKDMIMTINDLYDSYFKNAQSDKKSIQTNWLRKILPKFDSYILILKYICMNFLTKDSDKFELCFTHNDVSMYILKKLFSRDIEDKQYRTKILDSTNADL